MSRQDAACTSTSTESTDDARTDQDASYQQAYDEAYADLQFPLRVRRLDIAATRALAQALSHLVGERLVDGVYDSDAPQKLCGALVAIAERLAEPLDPEAK